MFTYHQEGHLLGIVSTHVDDFCWAGSKYFEAHVISAIRKSFKVKTEEKHQFRYLGLDLFQEADQILIKQDVYVQGIEVLKLTRKCAPTDAMTDHEMSQCRSILGKLNWIATQDP